MNIDIRSEGQNPVVLCPMKWGHSDWNDQEQGMELPPFPMPHKDIKPQRALNP